jgi:hypothetical protein
VNPGRFCSNILIILSLVFAASKSFATASTITSKARYASPYPPKVPEVKLLRVAFASANSVAPFETFAAVLA